MPLQKPYKRPSGYEGTYVPMDYKGLKTSVEASLDPTSISYSLTTISPAATSGTLTLLTSGNYTLAAGATQDVDVQSTGNGSAEVGPYVVLTSLVVHQARAVGVVNDEASVSLVTMRGHTGGGGSDHRIIARIAAAAGNSANITVTLKTYRLAVS